MIDHGYQTMSIEAISYNQSDIRRRTKETHVIELADSIKQGIMIEPPLVNKKTKVLIAGRDRVAANLLLGNKRVWCHLVDADAQEVKTLERHENLFRRQDDRDALIAEEQEARARAIEAEEKANPAEEDQTENGPKKKGRKPTAKGKARKEIAKKLGTSPEAVRKAGERAAKKKAIAEGKEPPKRERPPGIKGDMLEIRAAIGLIVKPVIAAQSAARKLLKLAPVMGKGAEATIQRLDQHLHECSSVVKFLRPDKVCAYCKGGRLIEGRDCSGCGGAGYLTEGAAEVPEAVAAE